MKTKLAVMVLVTHFFWYLITDDKGYITQGFGAIFGIGLVGVAEILYSKGSS